MKEKISNLKYIVIFIGAMLMIPIAILVFLRGSVFITETIYGIIPYIFWIPLIIIITLALPLSIFKKTRIFGSGLLYFLSYPFSLILWVLGFIYTYILFGSFITIIGLFICGIGVVPLGFLAVLFNGYWFELLEMIIMLVLIYSIRIIAVYFGDK